jgi:glucose/arabinose dehydrogenase
MMTVRHGLLSVAFALSACGGGGSTSAKAQPTNAPSSAPSTMPAACVRASSPAPTPTPPGPPPQTASDLTVPAGFQIQIIGNVPGARELAFAPNGDLFVGTNGSSVYLIANAEGQAAYSHVFSSFDDSPAAGVTVSLQNCSVYVGTQFGLYRIPYTIGDQTAQATPVKIASFRPGGSADHSTTTVAIAGNSLYASVGSSCNACTETDPTRATIQRMNLDGSGMTARAIHIRNAIALAVNPSSGTLWAGDAGQDTLPQGHPYEFFDAVTLHASVADYGWPSCEENHIAYARGANCTNTVAPLVVFPAYETPIGAAFYAPGSNATYAFPAQYRGGAFIAMHGSWHTNGSGIPVAPPRVVFVPLAGDAPPIAVNWLDPTRQWSEFVTGFQRADGSRTGRPTGVAVGPMGDVFVADDQTGAIYRIRP